MRAGWCQGTARLYADWVAHTFAQVDGQGAEVRQRTGETEKTKGTSVSLRFAPIHALNRIGFKAAVKHETPHQLCWHPSEGPAESDLRMTLVATLCSNEIPNRFQLDVK